MIGNLSEATLNEIVLSVDNTDVIVTSVERILPKNNIPKLETQLHLAALIVVLVGNSCVVKRILENSKTFLDWLVVVDSFLCLGTVGKYFILFI